MANNKSKETTPKTIRFSNDTLREIEMIIQQSYGMIDTDYIRDAVEEKLERDSRALETTSTRFHLNFAKNKLQNVRENASYFQKMDDFMQEWVLFLVENAQLTPSNFAISERSGTARDINKLLIKLQIDEPLVYDKIKMITQYIFKRRAYKAYFTD